MKVTMLKSVDGAEDGVRVKTYQEGKEYDLSHTNGARDLARVFVENKWARPTDAAKSVVPDETQDQSAPENKAIDGAQEVKAPAKPKTAAPKSTKK